MLFIRYMYALLGLFLVSLTWMFFFVCAIASSAVVFIIGTVVLLKEKLMGVF